MLADLQFEGKAIIGARRRQEDAWGTGILPPDEHGARLLAVVCDGLGGHPGGDVASTAARDAFLTAGASGAGPPSERLREALEAANRQVRAAAGDNPRLRGMATTLVGALFTQGRCAWVSVGDSFLFHYRGGTIRRANPLHTHGAELDEQARQGKIRWTEARMDYDRAMITSVVMGGRIEEVAEGAFDPEPDDLVILATDGVETLGEDGIAAVCDANRGADAGAIASAILGRIEEEPADYQDNATVVVVRPPAAASGEAGAP